MGTTFYSSILNNSCDRLDISHSTDQEDVLRIRVVGAFFAMSENSPPVGEVPDNSAVKEENAVEKMEEVDDSSMKVDESALKSVDLPPPYYEAVSGVSTKPLAIAASPFGLFGILGFAHDKDSASSSVSPANAISEPGEMKEGDRLLRDLRVDPPLQHMCVEDEVKVNCANEAASMGKEMDLDLEKGENTPLNIQKGQPVEAKTPLSKKLELKSCPKCPGTVCYQEGEPTELCDPLCDKDEWMKYDSCDADVPCTCDPTEIEFSETWCGDCIEQLKDYIKRDDDQEDNAGCCSRFCLRPIVLVISMGIFVLMYFAACMELCMDYVYYVFSRVFNTLYWIVALVLRPCSYYLGRIFWGIVIVFWFFLLYSVFIAKIGWNVIANVFQVLRFIILEWIVRKLRPCLVLIQRCLFAVCIKGLCMRVLLPCCKSLCNAFKWAFRTIFSVLRSVKDHCLYPIYCRCLAPIGRAIKSTVKWVYEHILAPIGRAIRAAARWIYKTILAPIGRTIRSVFRGIARAVRAAF